MLEGHWNIACKVTFPNYTHRNGLQKQLNVPDQRIFSNLKTDQKNKIMQALFDDNAKSLIYYTQSAYRDIIEAGEQYITSAEEYWSLPKMITTKSVFFPKEINGKGDYPTQNGPMFEHVLRNVSHKFSEPKCMNEQDWQRLANAVQYRNNGKIYPTQFIAVHQPLMRDINAGHLYMGMDTAQFSKYHLRSLNGRMKNNNVLEGMRYANVTAPQDGWLICGIEPYGQFPIVGMGNLAKTIELLGALEKEFILPHYKDDKNLAMAEEKMNAFRTNYDPTHWSSISAKQIDFFDEHNEEKIDYEEDIAHDAEPLLRGLFRSARPFGPFHNGQNPLGLN